VLDTVIDDLEIDSNRSWGPGASPKSAVLNYMKGKEAQFINLIDYESRSKLSVAPKGIWLRT
jgi:cephalosporin hydroxylase